MSDADLDEHGVHLPTLEAVLNAAEAIQRDCEELGNDAGCLAEAISILRCHPLNSHVIEAIAEAPR